MNFMPLSATALPLLGEQLRKENIDRDNSAASGALSDVSEDRTPSTAESDDRRTAASDGSEQPDSSDAELDDLGPESGINALRVQKSPKEVYSESDSDEEAVSSGAETCTEKLSSSEDKCSSSEGTPLSSRSENLGMEVLSLQNDGVLSEPDPHPEFAAVLRWDSERGAWIPDEIEITDPPPLPPFATLLGDFAEPHLEQGISLSQGLRKEAAQVLRLELSIADNHASWDKSRHPWDKHWASWDAAYQNPQPTNKEVGVKTPLRSISGAATPFTPASATVAKETNVAALRGSTPWNTGVSGNAILSSQRTRLSAHAAAFVPLA